MILRHETWYHLPDGTRLRARAAEAGAFRLEDAAGTPHYHVLPNVPSLYRLVAGAQPHLFHAVSCDLTLDDLTPEPELNINTLDYDDEDRPICPQCHIAMHLKQEFVICDVYRCSSCGVEIEV